MSRARRVPLTSGGFAIVDARDFERVRRYTWQLGRVGPYSQYVMTTVRGAATRSGATSLYLHRFILRAQRGQRVDHRDGDVLNNRRGNLRRATPTQSSHNTRKKRPHASSSKYKGVTRVSNGWIVQIRDGSRRHTLGRYNDEVRAARAYDDAARKWHGSFACLNFPKRGERSALASAQ